jgi:hypothetical protein
MQAALPVGVNGKEKYRNKAGAGKSGWSATATEPSVEGAVMDKDTTAPKS